MDANYSIEFTAAGLDYVRRVLGARPFDEAGPLIFELERQRGDQDKARAEGRPVLTGDAGQALLSAVQALGAGNGAAAFPAVPGGPVEAS